MDPRGRWPALAGFSLLEVLVAACIMTVLAIPLISAYQVSHAGTTREAHHLRALFLANEVKERLRRQNDWAVSFATRLVDLQSQEFPLPEGYTVRVTRRPRKGGLLEARIEVSWKVGSQQLSTHLTTLLSVRPANGSREAGP